MEPCGFFQRFEQKYLLDERTCQLVQEGLLQHMAPDRYGVSQISSIYFDTPDHRMIRRSLEKPAYKEKLRLRCYGDPGPQDPVFVELKKKYGGTVYKRRVEMPLREAEAYLYHGCRPAQNSQILREVDYMRHFYEDLHPEAYISYTRIALYGLEDPALRVTFDWDLLWRDQNLHLGGKPSGQLLLPQTHRLMEIKISNAMPLWMAHLFDELQIFPASFSKYGAAYQKSVAQGAVNRTAEIALANGTTKGMIICA